MGRIRTVQIQNITNELISKYSIDNFTDNYSQNKDKLHTMPEEFPSKKIMNKVAGSLTRSVKKHKDEMQKLLNPSEPAEEEEYEEETD